MITNIKHGFDGRVYMGKLVDFKNAYEGIMSSNADTDTKNQQLTALMTKMEIVCKIPFLHNPQWENQNSEIIALYRKISNSRIM
jgi:hypothetical protein